VHRHRKLLISCLILGIGHSHTSISFSESVVVSSSDTIWPRYRTSCWKNWHFSRLSFRRASRNCCITFHRLSRCSWNIWPITVTASRCTRHYSYMRPLKTVLRQRVDRRCSSPWILHVQRLPLCWYSTLSKEKRNRNEKCVGEWRNCIVSECNMEIDLCEIWHLN
jgi:hypothetical protein